MSDRKLTDAYWMQKGASEERAKIFEKLYQLLSNEVKDVAGDMDRARGIEMAIDSIKEDGAYEVGKDTLSAEIEFGVAALELGVLRERERILALLKKRTGVVDGDLMLAEYWSVLVALIKGDPLKELRQLAEETGEYETFDNPLIDEEYNRLDNPIIGGVQKLNDLLGIIGK